MRCKQGKWLFAIVQREISLRINWQWPDWNLSELSIRFWFIPYSPKIYNKSHIRKSCGKQTIHSPNRRNLSNIKQTKNSCECDTDRILYTAYTIKTTASNWQQHCIWFVIYLICRHFAHWFGFVVRLSDRGLWLAESNILELLIVRFIFKFDLRLSESKTRYTYTKQSNQTLEYVNFGRTLCITIVLIVWVPDPSKSNCD